MNTTTATDKLTAVFSLAQDRGADTDAFFIHGATIAQPVTCPLAVFDHDADEWVVQIDVEPSEDEAPYLTAIEAAGFRKVGEDGENWIVEQVGSL